MASTRAFVLALGALLLLATMPALGFHATSTGPVARDLTFTSVSGNEWWVQVRLGGSASSSVTAVEAKDDDGPWVALAKKSWGDWAASFHVEPGHRVMFAARFSDGAYMESCWITHPEGVAQCAGPAPPPPTGGNMSATFTPRNGNEWWIQVRVSAPQPLAGVDARLDCGAWQALKLQSYGDWAASYHAPQGTHVQFRATSTSGAVATSGGFTWTSATPTAGCGEPTPPPQPTGFDAQFTNAGGNAWWVEVTAKANERIAGVDARVQGSSTWRALTLRSWGDWAASFNVPDGSLVEFRATSATSGAKDVSDTWFRWPSGAPVARNASQWPHEGSYVKYALDSGGGAPDGSVYSWEELNATLTWSQGRWEMRCQGWAYFHNEYDDPVDRREPVDLRVAVALPMGPTATSVGQTVPTSVLDGCRATRWDDYDKVTVEAARDDWNATRDGQAVKSPVWVASWDSDCMCQGSTAAWHRGTGLMLSWWWGGRSSHVVGDLVDTDAPIAVGDPAVARAPAPAWPVEGSYARYEGADWYNSSYGYSNGTFRAEYVYHDGAWVVTCIEDYTSYDSGFSHSEYGYNATPPFGPVRIVAGDHVAMRGEGCYAPGAELVAKGKFLENTTRGGTAIQAQVWWADELPEDEAMGWDGDAWWDQATGLVLRWEEKYQETTVMGRLVDTDAPLASFA